MIARTPIAVAALVRDGLVLMVHRHPMRPAYPDCWDLVGGHVDAGESPDSAVRRECREELGVAIDDPLPIPMTVTDPTLDMYAFLVTRWEGEPVNAAPDEHDDLRWFRPHDLADLELAHAASLSSIVGAVQVATGSQTNRRTSGVSVRPHGAPGVPQADPQAGREAADDDSGATGGTG